MKWLDIDGHEWDADDPFLIHEALDRTHVILCAVDDNLGNHPAVASREELLALVLEAENALGKLYQALGALRGE